MIDYLLIIISGFIFSAGSYIVWPSRFNILAHIKLGFLLTSLVIPILLANVLLEVDQELIRKFAIISFVGAVFYMIGICFGFYYKLPLQQPFVNIISKLHEKNSLDFINKYTPILTIFGVTIMIFCFIGMGFIPAFSDNPLQAKFFRGEYKDAYQPFALPYRIGYQIVSLCSVVNLALYLTKRKNYFLVLTLMCTFFLFLTLVRGPTLYAGILFLGCLAALYKRYFWPYIVFIAIIYPLGSLFYLIIGNIFGIDQFKSIYDSTNIWSSIASGAPDITDQLTFLQKFDELGGNITYGKTYLGGLIPYNYLWNPAVYSLYIVNNGLLDINSINSGGLRVGLALWGYTSFSWLGIVLLPLFSGTIWGASTKIVRKFTKNLVKTEINKFSKAGVILLSLLIYENIFRFFTEFYTLNLYGLATLLLIIFLLYGHNIFVQKVASQRKPKQT